MTPVFAAYLPPQTTTLNQPAVTAPARTGVDVFCVGPGRWIATAEGVSAMGATPDAARSRREALLVTLG